MCLGFCQYGAHTIIVDKNIPTDTSLLEKAESFGVVLTMFQGDVTFREDMERVASEVAEKFGRIDILVNNAGINVSKDKRKYVHEFFDDDSNLADSKISHIPMGKPGEPVDFLEIFEKWQILWSCIRIVHTIKIGGF